MVGSTRVGVRGGGKGIKWRQRDKQKKDDMYRVVVPCYSTWGWGRAGQLLLYGIHRDYTLFDHTRQ